MTALELFKKYAEPCSFEEGPLEYLVDKEDFIEALKEYTNFHVKAALQKAVENTEIVCSKELSRKRITACKSCEGGGCEEPIVNPVSILNAYNIDNIK